MFLLESYSTLGSEDFSHRWPLGTLMALPQRVGFVCPRQLDAGGRRGKFLQIVITPHLFSRKKRFYGSSPRSLIGSMIVRMQNQPQSNIELAQHLCIDWLIAAMGSVCYESQCVCVCVCVFFPFILDINFVAGRTSRVHTGFFIRLPSAVRALIFLARRIQPFLSLVDREVEFCVLTV